MNKSSFNSLLLLFLSFFASHQLTPTTGWNWHVIDTNNTKFPQSFGWGITTLTYEIEGYSKTSTWSAWENYNDVNNSFLPITRSINLVDRVGNYHEDIQLMKNMGINTYCFSIDWSRIEPEQGRFDLQEIQRYIDLCADLVANNIKPIAITKDLTDPLWFGYLGGFEHEKNIYLFERYCVRMYQALGLYVDKWVTFWAPENYAILGYLAGTISPGVKNAHRAVTVLKNELEAHVRVYNSIKSAPNGDQASIGIIKHVHALEAWHFWDKPSCYMANKLSNELFYSFFTTGEYSIRMPIPGKLGAWISHSNAAATQSLDFIGINYYGHGYIKNLVNHTANPKAIPTDIPGISVYPEGLYDAIQKVSKSLAKRLNIPMIITQNGIATTDEKVRELYLERHIYSVSKAISEGYNVIGYCYYSLLDGFSWGGYDKKFGLYSVDKETLERTKKLAAHCYSKIINKL